MNNYELHSLFEQGSDIEDQQRYTQVMQYYPDNLAIVHDSSLVIGELMMYSSWQQDVYNCVGAWCCMAASRRHLAEMMDAAAEQYCNIAISARYSGKEGPGVHNALYANYYDTLSDIVEFVDNALMDCNAPYFENMLAYRLMGYSVHNRSLLFTKIPYLELKDNYKRCNRFQL